MIIWLYTESAAPLCDGPYYQEDDAMTSNLWEWLGVCVWIEQFNSRMGGWVYENVKWDGHAWVTTSSGVRPAEPIRPECLSLAVHVPA